MAPLDPTVLKRRLPDLLPEPERFDSAQEAIAALLHTAMTELGFRLTAVTGHPSETPILNNVLPEGWAQNGCGHHLLWYEHDQSRSKIFLAVWGDEESTFFYPFTMSSGARLFLRIHCGSPLIGIIQHSRAFGRFSNDEFILPPSFPYVGRPSDIFVSSDQIAVPISKFQSEIDSLIFPASGEDINKMVNLPWLALDASFGLSAVLTRLLWGSIIVGVLYQGAVALGYSFVVVYE